MSRTYDDIKISVITPVYNAEKYLRASVESAVHLDEVFEIVLVEDGSSDDSFRICEELKEKYPHKIRLYTHPDRKNMGAGATRNLAIKKATGNYIAFLDADDIYLQNRFKNTVELIRNNRDVDGTHSMLGVFYENNGLKEKFGKRYEKPTGLHENIEPSDLFETLIKGRRGYFSIDTLTVKKSLIEEVGYFDETLRISQDAHFIWKLALCGNLLGEPGDIIVAKRRVHEDNRITHRKNFFLYHKKLLPSFLKWAKDYNKNIKEYLSTITLRHLGYLEGLSLTFSDKNSSLINFLFIKELINTPFYFKKLLLKYAFDECVCFLCCRKLIMLETYDEYLNEFKRINFQKRINKLAKKYKNKKIIIYGAGIIFDVITDNFDTSSLNIEYVSDIKFNEFGEYKGFKAIPYKNISEQNPDIVLIALQYNRIIASFFKDEIFPKYGKFKYIYL